MTTAPIILGTAGHIDHGKSALIKALTGTDPDRLKEEKLRGITIELGFAELDLPSGQHLGIVDVPGHERFVRHMVAGASGMDLVALVIAADEGVMPQTREHLEICQLLRVKQGLVVLTKVDLVEPDWLELVEEEVREALKGTFLDGAPIVSFSSVTGVGKEHLLATLADPGGQTSPPSRSPGFFACPSTGSSPSRASAPWSPAPPFPAGSRWPSPWPSIPRASRPRSGVSRSTARRWRQASGRQPHRGQPPGSGKGGVGAGHGGGAAGGA